MRLLLALISTLYCLLPALLNAQESPARWLAPSRIPVAEIPRRALSRLDNASLQQAEQQQRRPGRAPQFAESRQVDIRPQQTGVWEVLDDGRSVWRYRIQSPGAYSLNLGFERFYLPEGAVFLMYDPSGEDVLGPFTVADNELHSALWTPAIEGDEVVLELQLPPGVPRQKADLWLRYVNHDFSDVASVLSGNCNIDVACSALDGYPEIDGFREVIQSVATFTVDGKYHCSGFLINNTANNCAPYFLTAHHCEVDSLNAATVVVYWNYQNSTCRSVGSPGNGRPGNGSKQLFNSGAYMRADYAASDMTLLELDDPVRPEANAFFAGWNIDTILPSKGVASIHHSASEEKRFSFCRQPIYRGTWGKGILRVPTGDHLIIPSWDLGVTEDGSSGGPLFNQNQEAIGQLHGGAAACGNNAFDAFGWIGISWEGGGTPRSQLRYWLDPVRSGQKSMTGRWNMHCSKTINIDTAFRELCAGGSAIIRLTPDKGFVRQVSLQVLNTYEGLSFSFEKNPVSPGTAAHLQIQAAPDAKPARYPISVRATDGIDTVYISLLVEVRKVADRAKDLFPADGEVDVPAQTTLKWAPIAGADSYEVVLATDAAFRMPVFSTSTKNPFIAVDSLENTRTYYWKVRALNRCGYGEEATASFHTSPDWRLLARKLPEERCQSDQLAFELFVGDGLRAPLAFSYVLENGISMPLRTEIRQDTLVKGYLVRAYIDDLTGFAPGLQAMVFRVQDAFREVETRASLYIKRVPDAPRLLLPLADTSFIEDNPLLTWSPSRDATLYRLELSRSASFEEVLEAHILSGSFQKRVSSLDAGVFYWRVVAGNSCGAVPSAPRAFSVHTGNVSLMGNLLVAMDPNPTNGVLQVLISDPVNEVSIDVFSLTGQLLRHVKGQPLQTSWSLDLSAFPDGMYIVRLQHRLSSISRRIVLQR